MASESRNNHVNRRARILAVVRGQAKSSFRQLLSEAFGYVQLCYDRQMNIMSLTILSITIALDSSLE